MNSLPRTVTRQRRGCDLNPGPSAPESSTLTTRLPSHPDAATVADIIVCRLYRRGPTTSADHPPGTTEPDPADQQHSASAVPGDG